jgi:hypothetical protein
MQQLERWRETLQNIPLQEQTLFFFLILLMEISFTAFLVSPLFGIGFVTFVASIGNVLGLWDRVLDRLQNFAIMRGLIDEADRVVIPQTRPKRKLQALKFPFLCKNPDCNKASCMECFQEWAYGNLHVCHEKEQVSERLIQTRGCFSKY